MFQVGETVRLTASFLRSTGQYTGPEPFNRWIVLACEDKGSSSMVTTNEERDPEEFASFTAEEVKADPGLKYRRILAVNLERCRP